MQHIKKKIINSRIEKFIQCFFQKQVLFLSISLKLIQQVTKELNFLRRRKKKNFRIKLNLVFDIYFNLINVLKT